MRLYFCFTKFPTYVTHLLCCVCPWVLPHDETKKLQQHFWDRLGQGPRTGGLPSSPGNTLKCINTSRCRGGTPQSTETEAPVLETFLDLPLCTCSSGHFFVSFIIKWVIVSIKYSFQQITRSKEGVVGILKVVAKSDRNADSLGASLQLASEVGGKLVRVNP